MNKSPPSSSQPPGEEEFGAQILIIGDSQVGQSSILLRYVHDKFTSNYTATIGLDFLIKKVQVNNVKMKMQLWDTAGQEKFRPVLNNYYQGTQGVVFVFDYTDPKSLNDINYWLREINNKCGNGVKKVIIGNKIDLEPIVSQDEVSQMNEEHKIPLFQVSALTGENITLPFENLAAQLAEQFILSANQQSETEEINSPNQNNQSFQLKKPTQDQDKDSNCC